MHNYNYIYNFKRNYRSTTKKRVFTAFASMAVFLIFSANQLSAQEKTEIHSKMPAVVTPLLNSSSPNSLYKPGKTNITEIPAPQHDLQDNPENINEVQVEPDLSAQENTNSSRKESTSSADFLKLKSLGLLSNIKNLLADKNTKLPSLISELNTAKSNLESNADSDEKNSQQRNNHFSASDEEVSILRFEVNGQNLQPACYNLYFSGIEQNGAFLLTGDFRYSQGQKPCTETFYFLFTAEGTENGKFVYKVTSAVNQNLKNDDSPLLAVAKFEDLNAYKTGGFISIHDTKDDVAIDFLLTLKDSTVSSLVF